MKVKMLLKIESVMLVLLAIGTVKSRQHGFGRGRSCEKRINQLANCIAKGYTVSYKKLLESWENCGMEPSQKKLSKRWQMRKDNEKIKECGLACSD